MWKNYLKIAFRNLIRNRSFSLINLFGLALGLSAFVLIAAYVHHEYSFDRFHKHSSRIYRLGDSLNWSGNWEKLAMTPAPMGPALQQEYPQVELATRIMPWKNIKIRYQNKTISHAPAFADNNFFRIFSFKLVSGNTKQVFSDPKTVVLSESFSKKLFGKEDPVGKTIEYEGKGSLKVSAVFKDFPENSHLQHDMLISMQFTETENFGGPGFLQAWVPHNFHTYLLLQNSDDKASLSAAFPAFTEKYFAEESDKFKPFLEPLEDIYLHSDAKYGTGVSGDAQSVYLFTAISLMLILIAAVNYMNLSTARASRRAKEVGIRKVSGSTRKSLIIQFLSESMIITLIAFTLAMLITELSLPYFNQLTLKSFTFSEIMHPQFIIFLAGLAVFLGLAAGIYPALYLSAFMPVKVLKGTFSPRGNAGMRRILVVFQFVIAVGLIIGTITVYQQLQFLQSKDRGYRTENVYYFRLDGETMEKKASLLREEVMSLSGVDHASVTSRMMGSVYGKWFIQTENMDEKSDVILLNADNNLIPLLGLEMAQGRNFRADNSDKEGIILNERAAKKFGITKVSNQKVTIVNQYEYQLTGIVKDFNYASLYKQPEPLAITYPFASPWNRYLAVSLNGNDHQAVLDEISSKIKNIEADAGIHYSNLQKHLESQYTREVRMGKIIITFSLLAIVIACLGLFGLSSFMVDQKKKEIGIRKVLGATISQLISFLSGKFIRWITLANIISWPIVFYLIDRWLQNFPYHITIKVWYFLAAAIVSVFIALITVLYQTIRAAQANPAETLKYE
ncbi:MAG TPA: ABC transporter permease [Bacteroidales bacterium]|nr:ABC transporter permease [Bacteroidales bacterium]